MCVVSLVDINSSDCETDLTNRIFSTSSLRFKIEAYFVDIILKILYFECIKCNRLLLLNNLRYFKTIDSAYVLLSKCDHFVRTRRSNTDILNCKFQTNFIHWTDELVLYIDELICISWYFDRINCFIDRKVHTKVVIYI